MYIDEIKKQVLERLFSDVEDLGYANLDDLEILETNELSVEEAGVEELIGYKPEDMVMVSTGYVINDEGVCIDELIINILFDNKLNQVLGCVILNQNYELVAEFTI